MEEGKGNNRDLTRLKKGGVRRTMIKKKVYKGKGDYTDYLDRNIYKVEHYLSF